MLLDTNYPWKFCGEYPQKPRNAVPQNEILDMPLRSERWGFTARLSFRLVSTHTPSVHLKILLFLFTKQSGAAIIRVDLELLDQSVSLTFTFKN